MKATKLYSLDTGETGTVPKLYAMLASESEFGVLPIEKKTFRHRIRAGMRNRERLLSPPLERSQVSKLGGKSRGNRYTLSDGFIGTTGDCYGHLESLFGKRNLPLRKTVAARLLNGETDVSWLRRLPCWRWENDAPLEPPPEPPVQAAASTKAPAKVSKRKRNLYTVSDASGQQESGNATQLYDKLTAGMEYPPAFDAFRTRLHRGNRRIEELLRPPDTFSNRGTKARQVGLAQYHEKRRAAVASAAAKETFRCQSELPEMRDWPGWNPSYIRPGALAEYPELQNALKVCE